LLDSLAEAAELPDDLLLLAALLLDLLLEPQAFSIKSDAIANATGALTTRHVSRAVMDNSPLFTPDQTDTV
jgi:hypothetical protein